MLPRYNLFFEIQWSGRVNVAFPIKNHENSSFTISTNERKRTKLDILSVTQSSKQFHNFSKWNAPK